MRPERVKKTFPPSARSATQEEQGLKQISILVPCYNEEENIRPFWEEIRRVFMEFF